MGITDERPKCMKCGRILVNPRPLDLYYGDCDDTPKPWDKEINMAEDQSHDASSFQEQMEEILNQIREKLRSGEMIAVDAKRLKELEKQASSTPLILLKAIARDLGINLLEVEANPIEGTRLIRAAIDELKAKVKGN